MFVVAGDGRFVVLESATGEIVREVQAGDPAASWGGGLAMSADSRWLYFAETLTDNTQPIPELACRPRNLVLVDPDGARTVIANHIQRVAWPADSYFAEPAPAHALRSAAYTSPVRVDGARIRDARDSIVFEGLRTFTEVVQSGSTAYVVEQPPTDGCVGIIWKLNASGGDAEPIGDGRMLQLSPDGGRLVSVMGGAAPCPIQMSPEFRVYEGATAATLTVWFDSTVTRPEIVGWLWAPDSRHAAVTVRLDGRTRLLLWPVQSGGARLITTPRDLDALYGQDGWALANPRYLGAELQADATCVVASCAGIADSVVRGGEDGAFDVVERLGAG